eukprot:TRINITY_DN19892_c0_g1_i1.p1 TRINITY_DN19892_c0_g1~~TRINITY_DN19892_c0_g1_i1.p1  ORF type:complete len:321 (+),score=78.68 TRINITY_DN19892_c0_g1_i1:59-964(+)
MEEVPLLPGARVQAKPRSRALTVVAAVAAVCVAVPLVHRSPAAPRARVESKRVSTAVPAAIVERMRGLEASFTTADIDVIMTFYTPNYVMVADPAQGFMTGRGGMELSMKGLSAFKTMTLYPRSAVVVSDTTVDTMVHAEFSSADGSKTSGLEAVLRWVKYEGEWRLSHDMLASGQVAKPGPSLPAGAAPAWLDETCALATTLWTDPRFLGLFWAPDADLWMHGAGWLSREDMGPIMGDDYRSFGAPVIESTHVHVESDTVVHQIGKLRVAGAPAFYARWVKDSAGVRGWRVDFEVLSLGL